ncbi:MAG: molybdopterin molybdenumtransferase MoeA, partial [Comamonas sp.]
MTLPPTLQEIADRLEGYDAEAMDMATARRFLEALAPAPAHSEMLALSAALDRVLAQDVVSPIDVPAHDNSAMDGFAFAGGALRPGQGLRLRIVGRVHAGATWPQALQPGECLRIMTGAVMPAGADTVVPQELVALEENHQLWIAPDLLAPGANRRQRGEDLQQG